MKLNILLSSYVDDLYDEIRRLRNVASTEASTQQSNIPSPHDAVAENPGNPVDVLDSNTLQATGIMLSGRSSQAEALEQNPVLEERPWFQALTPEMPLLISEASDVAFATRSRQVFAEKAQTHFQRVEYVQDGTIFSLWNIDPAWPSPSRSRLLLKVVLNTVGRRDHLLHASSTRQLLDQAIGDPSSCDVTSKCKFFAIFALGELYAARTCPSEDQFPGLGYYVYSTRMLRALNEQPSIDCVETLVMLVGRLSPQCWSSLMKRSPFIVLQ